MNNYATLEAYKEFEGDIVSSEEVAVWAITYPVVGICVALPDREDGLSQDLLIDSATLSRLGLDAIRHLER